MRHKITIACNYRQTRGRCTKCFPQRGDTTICELGASWLGISQVMSIASGTRSYPAQCIGIWNSSPSGHTSEPRGLGSRTHHSCVHAGKWPFLRVGLACVSLFTEAGPALVGLAWLILEFYGPITWPTIANSHPIRQECTWSSVALGIFLITRRIMALGRSISAPVIRR